MTKQSWFSRLLIAFKRTVSCLMGKKLIQSLGVSKNRPSLAHSPQGFQRPDGDGARLAPAPQPPARAPRFPPRLCRPRRGTVIKISLQLRQQHQPSPPRTTSRSAAGAGPGPRGSRRVAPSAPSRPGPRSLCQHHLLPSSASSPSQATVGHFPARNTFLNTKPLGSQKHQGYSTPSENTDHLETVKRQLT